MTTTVPPPSAPPRTESTIFGGNGLPLGKLFSIQVRLHVSVALIGTLIVASLARGVLPEWHPQWTDMHIWSAAVIAGLLFFASLIAHEFAHALVARHYGIRTEHITLFLFGAIAAIEREPQTPKQEMVIAAAGPAMSLSLALAFSGLTMMTDPTFFTSTVSPANLETSFANLSYLGTVTFWLSSINCILGLFNLIPGFPMDGGRILRAWLWWKSSDLATATRQAARGGILFGWLLVLYGAVLVINEQMVNGLWTAAIGYFISQLARSSGEQFLRNRALSHTIVADIMRTRFERVPQTLPLDTFVDDYLLRSTQRVWPVTKEGVDVGYISLEDVPAANNRHSNGYRLVADCMHPLVRSDSLDAKASGMEALRRLANRRLPMIVLGPALAGADATTIIGLIEQTDVLRWISQHPNLAATFELQDRTS